MNRTESQQELFDFLKEYTSFFKQMVQAETDKLDALVSNELSRIEHMISIAQANTKQLENIEQKRMQLQEKAGFGDMTFSELVEHAPQEDKKELAEMFGQVQKSVLDIKFYNEKSMGVAKTNLMRINPNAPLAQSSNAQAYGYAKDQGKKQVSMLETKI